MTTSGNNMAAEPVLTFSNEIMVAAVVFFFIAVVFVFFLYLYAKHYWVPDASLRSRSRALFVFSEPEPLPPLNRHGLDKTILSNLPVTVFQSVDSKDGLECSVCLCELSDGEQVRMLPKCSHGFHLQCIDMWFQSHSTCPLCRSAVGTDTPPTQAVARDSSESSSSVSLPTNTLFWGTHDQVSSGAAAEPASSSVATPGTLVIEIPRRAVEASSASTDTKTPPTSARLRSLRRLLSQGRRAVVGSSSAEYDIEQGGIRTELATPRSNA